MDFKSGQEEQELLLESLRTVMERGDFEDYFKECDEKHVFPQKAADALARGRLRFPLAFPRSMTERPSEHFSPRVMVAVARSRSRRSSWVISRSMTHAATFIINGAERAIVSQLVRSPGVYYGKELDKTDKVLLSATVIPYRGAWLEYETDANDVFYVRIDKNRKIPITSFIRAIGVKTDAEIKELFGEDPLIVATLDKDPAHDRRGSPHRDLQEDASGRAALCGVGYLL